MSHKREARPVDSGFDDKGSEKATAILHKQAGVARPSSAIEAMMMNMEEFWDERQEHVLELFDTVLNDREKWVINALIFEQKSTRQVAAELGLKSPGTILNIRDGALAKLRKAMTDDTD